MIQGNRKGVVAEGSPERYLGKNTLIFEHIQGPHFRVQNHIPYCKSGV